MSHKCSKQLLIRDRRVRYFFITVLSYMIEFAHEPGLSLKHGIRYWASFSLVSMYNYMLACGFHSQVSLAEVWKSNIKLLKVWTEKLMCYIWHLNKIKHDNDTYIIITSAHVWIYACICRQNFRYSYVLNHEPWNSKTRLSKMFVWPCCNFGKWYFLSSLNVLVHNIVDLITSFNILLEHEIIVVLVDESSPSFAPSCTVVLIFFAKLHNNVISTVCLMSQHWFL